MHNSIADLLIATNSATTFEFIHYLGCAEAHVHTIVGGVDTNTFLFDAIGREKVRDEFGIGKNDFVIGFLGRFDPVKGVHELITAVGALLSRKREEGPSSTIPPCKLLLAGFPQGISVSTVEQWLSENNLSDVAIITGKRPDVAACISAMDLGVVASQGSEAIARAAFEIMSCGVPLVGTCIGVMPDLLPEQALSPVGDQQALNDLLHTAVCDDVWRNNLREEELSIIANLSEQDFLQATLMAYNAALEHCVSKKNAR